MSPPAQSQHIPIRVKIEQAGGPPIERSFTSAFRIGRRSDCEVRIDADVVSRVHVEVAFEHGDWWVRDLDSRNGTFVDGRQVQRVRLDGPAELRLARDGPIVRLSLARPVQEPRTAVRPRPAADRPGDRPTSMQQYIERYVTAAGDTRPVGENTMMIRRAVATVQARQRRKYYIGLGVAVGLGVLLLVLAALQRAWLSAGDVERQQMAQELERQREAAAQLFDDMKSLDLQIAQLRSVVEGAGLGNVSGQLEKLEESRQRMARRYDGYVKELGTYRALDAREQIIYRMARVFNESEFGMPAGFVQSVERTIRDYWRSPAGRDRFAKAVRRAEQLGYTPRIVETMRQHGLPPQFFYLALQESDFDTRAVGPSTRWGRAKGMWQFLGRTALTYGLDPGPYADRNLVDPQDERHDFAKSTQAAARYLRSIYGTLAQASGLLVIASYNWGEHRVAPRLDRLPGPQAIPAEALEASRRTPGRATTGAFSGSTPIACRPRPRTTCSRSSRPR
jgi:soluble lytic murein transglycosylase-like protein